MWLSCCDGGVCRVWNNNVGSGTVIQKDDFGSGTIIHRMILGLVQSYTGRGCTGQSVGCPSLHTGNNWGEVLCLAGKSCLCTCSSVPTISPVLFYLAWLLESVRASKSVLVSVCVCVCVCAFACM